MQGSFSTKNYRARQEGGRGKEEGKGEVKKRRGHRRATGKRQY